MSGNLFFAYIIVSLYLKIFASYKFDSKYFCIILI